MKSVPSVFLIVTMLSLALAVPPTSTPTQQGETIIVTSAADSGPGSLRQALLDAQDGDTITFDAVVFPPGATVVRVQPAPVGQRLASQELRERRDRHGGLGHY